MIKIHLKSWPDPESVDDPERKRQAKLWKRWRKDCREKSDEIQNEVNDGKDPADVEVQDSLYSRTSIKKMYFASKTGPFRGKCVYCESFVTDLQRGDIEHFRPKGAVTDELDQPIRILDRSETERDHWGYYWLAYDVNNLMLSCQLCNQPSDGKLGKRTRFPLMSEEARACYHSDNWSDEDPKLINPLEEDPTEHLTVDPDTGIMVAKTPRGQACIDIFGLNKRDQLIMSRRSAAQKIDLLWQNPEENVDEIRQLLVDAIDAHTLASLCAYMRKMKALSAIGIS